MVLKIESKKTSTRLKGAFQHLSKADFKMILTSSTTKMLEKPFSLHSWENLYFCKSKIDNVNFCNGADENSNLGCTFFQPFNTLARPPFIVAVGRCSQNDEIPKMNVGAMTTKFFFYIQAVFAFLYENYH